MTRIIVTSILAAALSIQAAAQVNKEITVEREVVTTLRDAAPLQFTPEVSLRPVEKPTLDYSRRTITTRIPALFSLLEPAAVADSIAASPWRGYAALGYFPLYNLGASAGYRAVATGRTTLDMWMQYTGERYKHDAPLPDGGSKQPGNTLFSHDLALGLNLSQSIGSKSSLDLTTDYALARFNNPYNMFVFESPAWQSVNRYNIDARFLSRVNDLGYSVSLGYHLFSNAKGVTIYPRDYDLLLPEVNIRPVRENRVNLAGALFADIDETSSYRLDIDATMLMRSKSGYPGDPYYGWIERLVERKANTMGLITLTPSYRLKRDRFIMDLAARIDFTLGEGKFFHIAPDVKLTWMPSQAFAVYGRASGGEHLNTQASIFALDRFISPALWYESSHIPVEAEAGFRFGPFRGASLTLSAAYAVANDWLMPMAAEYGSVAFTPVDIRGWQFKACADYSFRHLASISLTATANPQKGMAHGYYIDRDRAKYTLAADLTVTPLKPLAITAGYELRACRSMRWNNLPYPPSGWCGTINWGPEDEYVVVHRLSNLANLHIGASWSFTDRLTAFIRAENILGRKTPSFALIPGQGFHGLVGAAYKF